MIESPRPCPGNRPAPKNVSHNLATLSSAPRARPRVGKAGHPAHNCRNEGRPGTQPIIAAMTWPGAQPIIAVLTRFPTILTLSGKAWRSAYNCRNGKAWRSAYNCRNNPFSNKPYPLGRPGAQPITAVMGRPGIQPITAATFNFPCSPCACCHSHL